MVRAVDHLHPDIDQGVAGQHATRDRFPDAGIYRGVVLLRDDPADDLVLDLDALAALVGLNVDNGMAVLTASAGLADELALALGGRRDGFTVGNLRCPDGGLHLELAHQPVPDDVQMQFAHAGDDQLAGFVVGEDTERRILLSQALQCLGHLVAIGAGVGLDRHRDDRFGEGRRLEHHVEYLVAERVAGGNVAQPHDRSDVTGVNGIHIGALVCLEHDQAADAVAFACARIVDGVTLLELAGVNADKHQLAHERIGPELKGKRTEIATVIRLHDDFRGFVIRLDGRCGGHLDR